MEIVGYTRARAQAHRDMQRAEIERWVTEHGHEVVGWVEDDGSAFTRPADRSELGSWLRGERGQFDALAVWSLDRLVRQAHHLLDLAEHCRIVCVGDAAPLASVERQHTDLVRFAAERVHTGRR